VIMRLSLDIPYRSNDWCDEYIYKTSEYGIMLQSGILALS
jgi:hypothetical protein